MTHQATVPRLIEDYFQRYAPSYREESDRRRSHPIFDQIFIPGAGWRHYPGRKRVSLAMFRKLRAEGVTVVAVSSPAAPGRRVDFQVREVLNVQGQWQRLPSEKTSETAGENVESTA